MEIKKECPQCSAMLEIDEENGVAHCPFCGYTKTLDDVRITHVNKNITRDEARIEEIKFKKHVFDTKLEKEETQRREQETKTTNKRRVKLIAALILVALIVVFSAGAKIATSIKHINDVKIGVSSKELIGEKYSAVESLLKDKGFSNIKLVEIADLSDSKADSDGRVSAITIDGEKSFKAKQWFPKKSNIKIEYHTMDPDSEPEIKLPWRSYHFRNLDYKVAKQELRDAGFENLQLVPIVDVAGLKNKKQMNLVEEVSIDGVTIFNEGDYVKKAATVTISFHTDKKGEIEALEEFRKEEDAIEHAGMFQIPEFESSYEKKRFDDVVKLFEAAGFKNIKTEPLMDLDSKNSRKADTVAVVSVSGKTGFKAGDWMSPDEEVVIRYHSPAAEQPDGDPVVDTENNVVMPENVGYYKGKKYDDVRKEFENLKFENITLVPLEDISKDVLNQIGKVAEISINGKTKFSSGDLFPFDSDVEIRYHSAKPESEKTEEATPAVTAGNIQMTKSASDYKGEKLDDVKSNLKSLGFTNIQEEALNDLGKDILGREGTVAEISINGETKFKADEIFPKDAKIVIRYHSAK